MWSFLYRFASPKLFYQLSERYIPWLFSISGICLGIGLVWALAFAPPDYQQGDAFRIIYVHVPSAVLSLGLYALMGLLSLVLIVWRIKIAGVMLQSVAEVGVTMAFLALVSGSVWGKPMWGTWWVWDARLTSELVLLMLYLSVLATAHAFSNHEKGDKILALLCLVGLVDLPIIHYSVYWWHTLHQGATLLSFAKPQIDGRMLYPLLFMLVGFMFFALALILVKSRYSLLWRERRQQWVRAVLSEKA